MASAGGVGIALALALLLAATAAEEKCRSGCAGASSTFKYAEGKTYRYNYEGSIDISLSTAEGQIRSTKVKATVLLSQLPNCNQIVRLQNVVILDGDGKKYTQIEDVDRPIRINFKDGKIEDRLCAEPDDNPNSLNLKRAIASLFQADLKGKHETDVFGLCPTEIGSRKEGGFLVIHKSRDLNKCAYRESIKQDFLATAFDLNSEIKSSPLLSGDFTSQQRVKNGVLDQAVVTENYLYVPFSAGRNGAKAVVQSKLQFAGESKEAPKSGRANEPRSIIFENPLPTNTPKSNVDTILEAVKRVSDTVDEVVGPFTAKSFVNLVKIVRESRKDDLLGVFNQIKAGVGLRDKEVSKKIFLDALFRAGTGDSIEVAIELLRNNQLTAFEKRLVYLGLSFVNRATASSLTSAASLLDEPGVPREAYLGIGALAGRFCRQHPCKNLDGPNKLIQKLASKIGDGKASDRTRENEIIYSLKALGNLNYLSDSILAKLVHVAQDQKAPTRLRVAALEAYLADPCKDKLKDSALSVLRDIEQDSEIRIKAFSVLTKCPDGKVANALKNLLENEPSYQVGGYIATALRNIRASANPDKELAKQQLGSILLPRRFPFDLRKYSFNAEFSYAVDTLGIANAVETDVIFSQDSFLPRSTGLNLTAQLFGHSFNFLEVTARQENLDRLLERYFGPKGGVTREARKIVKRNVQASEVEKFGKTLQPRTNKLNDDLDLDLSVKLFGSEFLFLNLNEDFQKYTPERVLDEVSGYVEDAVRNAKNFDRIVRSNVLFLDAELAYPTSLGFPLRLGVEGSSSIQIKTGGSVDLEALKSLDKKVNLKLTLIPSANIEVAGRITFDAFVVENGLKVASTLYTATGGDLDVEIDRGFRGIDVKFGLPVEKQTLVSATHDIVFTARELGQPEKSVPLKFSQNKDLDICFDQLNAFLGVTACAEVSGPNLSGDHVPILPFPLNGNSKYLVTLEREDVSLYRFRLLFSPGNDRKIGVELGFDALDKSDKKKIAVGVEAFLRPEVYFKATVDSPVKKAGAEARLVGTDAEKSVLGRLYLDDQEYYAKAGLAVLGDRARTVYRPILEYRTPRDKSAQKPPYNVEGQVVVEKSGDREKYIFENVKFFAPNRKTFAVNGNAGKEPTGYFVDLTVGDAGTKGSLKGRYKAVESSRVLDVEFQNSLNPHANFDLRLELKGVPGEGKLQSSLRLTHGKDLSSKVNTIKLINSVTYRNRGPEDFNYGTENSFSYPLVGAEAKFEAEATPKSFEYDLEVQHRDVKIGSELKLKHCQKKFGDYDLEFEAYGLNNRLEIEAKREIVGDGDRASKIENSVELNGRKLEIEGTVRHLLQPQNVDVGADLVVKITGRPNPIKIDNGLNANANELDANLKIASGADVIIDVFLKATRSGDANGSLKVNVKEYVTANGQVKSSKGVGNGDLLVEFVKLDRKVKGEAKFTVHDPNYNLALAVYPDLGRDPKKKFSLSTSNKINPTSVDSKNSVDASGYKLEANLKGNVEGDLRTGKANGEIELNLPDRVYVLGKFNRDVKTVGDVVNGYFVASVEQRSNRNAPGRKISIKGTAKDTDVKANVFDVAYNIAVDLDRGDNLNGDLEFKSDYASGHPYFRSAAKVYGSPLPNPLEGSFEYTGKKDRSGSYKLRTSYGPETYFKLEGDYDVDAGNERAYGGKFSTELKVPRVIKDAAIDASLRGELSLRKDDGRFEVATKVQNVDPITVSGSYGHADENGVSKCRAEGSIRYGKGKEIKGETSVVRRNPDRYEFDGKLALPTEKVKNLRLQVDTKRSEDGSVVDSGAVLTVDDKKYTLDSNLALSETKPSLKIVLTRPDGKRDSISGKANKIGERRFDGEIEVVYAPADFKFDATVDANLEDVDNFAVKVTLDSPTLKLNKIVAEAHNKGTVKGAKRIQFATKSDGKNVLSGSTSYKAHEEGNRFIVEGSGTVKLYDESKSANFKYIRVNLDRERNGESGFTVNFDATLGSRAVDSELKVTNKQFRIVNSYCEEKKQCAHVEIDSKTNVNDVSNFNGELEIAVDLRKLGLSHEFGLKAVTVRQEFAFDHTVDVHFQSDENSKYQYSVYFHPKNAGVSLTTPKRIVSLEAALSYDNKNRYEGRLDLYLDKKNRPREVTSLTGFVDVKDKEPGVRSEISFVSPGLNRPLGVKYDSEGAANDRGVTGSFELVLDVLVDESKKFVVTGKSNFGKSQSESVYEANAYVQITNEALGIDVKFGESSYVDFKQREFKYRYGIRYNFKNTRSDSGLSARATPEIVEITLKALNKDLVRSVTRLQLNRDSQVVDNDLSLYGCRPIASHLEVKNSNTLKYTAEYAGVKLEANAGLIVGQIADYRVEVYSGGAKKELARATVKLDDANFLKSDYYYSSDNVKKYLLDPTKEAIKNEIQEVKKLAPSVYKQVANEAEKLTDAVKGPDFGKAKAYYEREADKIKNEFLQDETIKNLGEFLRGAIGAAARALGEILAQLSDLAENVAKTIRANFAGVVDTFNKDVLPKLKEALDKLAKEAADVADKFADVFFAYLAEVSEFVDAHQDELKQIATSVNVVGEDLARFLLKSYEGVRAFFAEQLQVVLQEVKALPVFEEIEAQYEQIVKEYFGGSEQLKERIERVREDLLAALRELFGNVLKIVRKFSDAAAAPDLSVGPEFRGSTFAPEYLLKLPRLVAAKFSPLAYLLDGDRLLPSGLLESFSFNPELYVPPIPMFGLVVQGQHIFTFDGRHVTFPGKCDYLLARDSLDGNFSVVGSYSNGLLNAVTLFDRTESITLKKGGQVLLNNGNGELPVVRRELIAWRNYDSVTLFSKSGVRVVCGLQLVACGVHVDGFYHGRVRGLLGDGNYEPYDDFTLPNGRIAKQESEFGNAYKLSSACPNVKAIGHVGHGNEACARLFGRESSLRYCYGFVDPQNYRTACEHGLHQKVADTEFAIAVAYVAACNQRGIPIRVPDEYVQCRNSKQTYKIGDKFSVKTPGKAADVVLLVDQNKNNEEVYKELVQPLVQQLNQEFNAKGINDVEYHLVTYGGENGKYPAHVTVGGKYTFKGKAPNLKFAQSEENRPYRFDCDKIDEKNRFVALITEYLEDPKRTCSRANEILENLEEIEYDLNLAVGNTAQAKTYDAGLSYPFRAESVKVVLAITGNECEVGRFLPLQILRTLFYRNDQIFLNLVTPLGNFRVKDPKTTKETVGFNNHDVFTLGQAAKKKVDGGAELHKQLEYVDYCSRFTVTNGGNVFVTDNFLQTKGAQRKQFVQVTAHNIVDQVTGVEKGLDCECRFLNPFTAANECKVVQTKPRNVPGRKG